MLSKTLGVILAFGSWLGFQGQPDYPAFLKLEDAKAAAMSTGKPILVFSNCDQLGGRNKFSPIEHDLWSHPLLRKSIPEFHFVRCSDKKTAQAVGSKTVATAEVIFLDYEGEEICRDTVADPTEVDSAIGKALSKYANRAVNWIPAGDSRFMSGTGTNAPYLLLFYTATEKAATSDVDSEAVMKALEDRTLVKFHARYLFVKMEFVKDSEEARKWGVSGAPTLLVVDSTKDAGPKSVVDRIYGKRTAAQLRQTLVKGLRVADKNRVASRTQ